MKMATLDNEGGAEPIISRKIVNGTRRGWKLRLFWWTLKYSSIVAGIIIASFYIVMYTTKAGYYLQAQADTGYAWFLSQLPHTEVIRFVQPERVSIEKVLDTVSKEMHFEPSILRAMAIQESGDYRSPNRVKEEPQLLEPWIDRTGQRRTPLIVPPKELNKIEKLLWASSHGVLQVVFGFHYKTCGLAANEWDRLHDPLTNIRCGAKVLKMNADKYRTSVRDGTQRLWLSLRDYNGSGPDAEQYANQVMMRITKIRNLNYGDGL